MMREPAALNGTRLPGSRPPGSRFVPVVWAECAGRHPIRLAGPPHVSYIMLVFICFYQHFVNS